MKIKPLLKASIVMPLNNGKVKLVHHQTIRLSQSYNSAEASYGAELEVVDQEQQIKQGFNRLEQMVEAQLIHKSTEQRSLLEQLAKNRND